VSGQKREPTGWTESEEEEEAVAEEVNNQPTNPFERVGSKKKHLLSLKMYDG
jgi:hypothetical protein